MKYLIPFCTALLAAAAVFFVMLHREQEHCALSSRAELACAGESAAKLFQETARDVSDRLAAFGQEVASDQMFSLRMLAENDRSAPEVALKAGRFMKPMGFSLLTIADSDFVILSSGDFPASAGSGVSQKAGALSEEAKVLGDNIMGKNVVTLQAKRRFALADSIPFYVMGGIVINETLLRSLSPRKDVRVLFRQGSSVIGIADVKTISDVKDGKIVINDRERPAVKIDLPSGETGDAPCLIAVMY